MNAPFSPGRGFRDPVLGPQAFFRAVLDAMSRPGQIVAAPDVGVEGPVSAPKEALGLLLTLCDHDTPVWLDAELRAASVARWLAFHANCPIVEDPSRAAFALIRNRADNPAISEFAIGDERYPDRSTTLIVLASSFEGGEPLILEGPGIETQMRISPAGLPESFVAQAHANHELFPRGRDFFLLADGAICGLPRSTRILTELR